MGFCAQFGSYVLMDIGSKKIVHLETISVSCKIQIFILLVASEEQPLLSIRQYIIMVFEWQVFTYLGCCGLLENSQKYCRFFDRLFILAMNEM